MRLLSWNIQWGRGADGRVDLARSAAAIRAAGEFDVICLQEVACKLAGLAGGAREDEVAFFAAAFPEHEPVFGAGLDVPDGEGGRAYFGNLLLSRRPVGQVFRHLLPSPADPAYPAMQRVCVEAVVDAPWGPLRVMSTHLEYYSQRQRRAQVEALRALQAQAADLARLPPMGKDASPAFAARPRPASAVLCGDFNCEPGSDAYRALQRPRTRPPTMRPPTPTPMPTLQGRCAPIGSMRGRSCMARVRTRPASGCMARTGPTVRTAAISSS